MPIRIELGPRDIKQGTFVIVRRDTGEKLDASRGEAASKCQQVLEDIQTNLYNK